MNKSLEAWHLPSPLPRDVGFVQNMLQCMSNTTVPIEMARLVTFVARAPARHVKDAVSNGGLMLQKWKERFPEWNLNGSRTLERLSGKLLFGLMNALRMKNKKWMGTLQSEGIMDPCKVATSSWEERSRKGLSWNEIKRAYVVICGDDPTIGDFNDMEHLMALVLHCTDRGYLTFDGIADGAPREVLPAAVAQLFLRESSSIVWNRTYAVWDVQARNVV
jgi:hypothetical protein